ncbi:hypothetical protein [Burkholderia sp. GbtcB21]|uniref:hypothetical protein n=1 Tax=Burkholderia sp. GbtcB21 TaxID=2824766 RepID=UPI001C2F715F|nr:hypothetical protein [Burkholderia sp. GbtcB21]
MVASEDKGCQMTTVTEHKENLARELATLDLASQLKFAAWCCFALVGERSIFDFLSRYSDLSASDIHARIVKGLDGVWEGDEAGADFSDLNILEWDVDEISLSDDADAQRALDLLAALSFLSEWVPDGVSPCVDRNEMSRARYLNRMYTMSRDF